MSVKKGVSPRRTKGATMPSVLRLSRQISSATRRIVDGVSKRHRELLARRPHRSFRRTYRRDYMRSLRLPGYVAFTREVWRTFAAHRRVFGLMVVVYAFMVILIGGITNQTTYQELSTLLQESGGQIFTGAWGTLGQAGLLAVGAFLGSPDMLTVDQQIYLSFMLLVVWLTTVWLLREILAGRHPKLRDGVYNAGSPIISTALIVLVLLIQILPLGIAAIAYVGLTSRGVLEDGFGMMLFSLFALCISALVLYWITSTLIAMVIITLQGMYPMRALKAASDLVVGRRLRILYRWLWAMMCVVVAWVVIMIPLVILDAWLKDVWPQFEMIPVMPIAAALMSAASTVWFSGYIYLLYRRIVSDDAKPA